MSKLTLSVFLNAYGDASSSNNPSLNNFKWARDVVGLAVDNPQSFEFSLAPGETKTLFSGTRTLAQDGTTQYSISLKPLTSNTYILEAVAGALPNFRTPRATGADATTQVTVTQNGPLLTFASSAGTAFNFAAVQVGDSVFIGDDFSSSNQGAFKVLAKTATSITVENELGVVEGPITLGADYADQVQIYSAAGVQVGDTLKITGGFSIISQKSYQVTAVCANSIEFYSNSVLPEEGPITTQALSIYSEAKQFVYLESNKNVSMIVNGVAAGDIEPFVIGSSTKPGIFMRKSVMYSMSVTNNGTDTATCYIASAE